MLHTDKAIIVEGRYDKARLSGIIDALIITTDGFGIFNSKRTFNSEFNSLEVNKGAHRGIHDFTIDISKLGEETVSFEGEFHDEAPSPKQGRIFLFRRLRYFGY